jgi:Cu(I)/Ag(I) efflux system membrane fusion protein
MSPDSRSGLPEPVGPASAAPAPPLSLWKKFRLVVKVVELRLRFVALMAITGLAFAYWDTLWNYYDKWMRPAAGKHAVVSGIEYYCPMHPQVVQDGPGTCPICGMPLAKRKKGEKATLPEGVLARVQLAPFQVKQAGIRTVAVGYAPLTETLTTVGTVEHDERRVAHIASKVPGKSRVEKLYVNFEGINVQAGQPLAELYSPELYQATRELLISQRRAAEGLRSTPAARGLGDPNELLRLSIDKLKLWGITQEQIDQMLRDGHADYRVPIYSPLGGGMIHVIQKNVVEGQYVEEGQPLFVVADLSHVWIRAKVYEDNIPLVRVGQEVEATVGSFPGEVFRGKVAFMFPHLDAATRTMDVRYDMDNPDHKLRPGMFATVRLKTPVAETPMFKDVRRAPASPGAKTVRLASLTAEDQKICPVTGAKLGSMGEPVPVEIGGRKVWTCCKACPPKLKADPAKYLAKLPPPAAGAAVAPTVEDQKICPVTGAKLGSMGDPILVEVEGRKVWTCCKACPPKLKAEPARYLARLTPPPQDEVLSVPELAVIDSGTRKVVFIETEPGIFDAREIVLGPRIGGRFPVLEGLAPGEKVAADGAFLIDAESRINPGAAPAESASGGPTKVADAPTHPPTADEGAHRH